MIRGMMKEIMMDLAKVMVQKKDGLIISKLILFAGDDWDINKVNYLLTDRVEVFYYNGEEFLEIFPLESMMVNGRIESNFKYRYLGWDKTF